jgi:ABC-type proline/glycine betaine transport system substrate-binding protein
MQVAVASLVDAKEEFAVVTFNTDGLLAGQSLKMLDMEEFTRDLNNQGKVLVRKDAHWKLGPKGLAMLGAVYIPSHDVSAMDLKVGKGQQAQEVAAEWVSTNKYIVNNWGWGSTTNL